MKRKQPATATREQRYGERHPHWTPLLARIQPDAAGIDCGAEQHYVAVPPDREAQPVHAFRTFTADLNQLADWLIQCRIKTVAMESTGVYWIPLFELLAARGFEVVLVNARHLRHVRGRKSDVSDCEWLRELHSVGLLSPSFRPAAASVVLRTYLRQRASLVEAAASHIQRMQKALTQMNLMLHLVLSDITGATGLKIIRCILAGGARPRTARGLPRPPLPCRARRNHGRADRPLSRRTPPSANRAAAILRRCAMSLMRTSTALGAFYRRLAVRTGKPTAITATARKLALLVYRVLRGDIIYSDPGADAYAQLHRTRPLKSLCQRAHQLGHALVDLSTGEMLAPHGVS